jgi:hypothetical protein
VPQLYVSADNHLNTQWIPARMWQERLPARHRERGPHVEETDRGSYWVWEGRLRKRSADGSSNRSLQCETFGELELPDGALPPSDPVLVRRHLDMANVHGAVFYGDGRKPPQTVG